MMGKHLLAVLAGLYVVPAVASGANGATEQLVCEYTYGGETRQLLAQPQDVAEAAYTLGTTPVGSYFLFRAVFLKQPQDQAAIKIYTYADMDSGPALIHQATYPYPWPAAHGNTKHRYGFTGLQSVYEPMRDGELQYWCGLTQTKAGKKANR